MISGLDHINIETNNLEETVRFYEEVLGFENEVRPPFDFLGAWLYAGGHPVIHLIEGASPSRRQIPSIMWHGSPVILKG